MSKLINLIYKKFGRLIVIERMNNDKQGRSRWLCQCNCKNKNKVIIQSSNLKNEHTQSCGCLQKEKLIKRSTKHGHTKNGKITKIYNIWKQMIQRCTNSNYKQYYLYGGRVITVCRRWLKFENFYKDIPGWKSDLQIDRINNNGDYCKNNCRWVTKSQQQRNTRSNRLEIYSGKTQLLIVWAEEYGINYHTLYNRIKRGWLIEKALLTPVRKKRRK